MPAGRRLSLTTVLALCLASPLALHAQEEVPIDPAAPAPADAASDATEQRLIALEREIAEMRAELDAEEAKDDEDELTGWQIQLRGGWFNLSHNHRDDIVQGSDNTSNNGWSAGLGIMAPLWRELGPIDLYGFIGLEYRQLRHDFTSVILPAATGGALPAKSGRISYVDITLAPTIRFPVTDTISPFVQLGGVIQVASPPEYEITYLDLGLLMGLGLDFKVHERISVGTDYHYTWFGAGDQDDEDYHQWAFYLGFNF